MFVPSDINNMLDREEKVIYCVKPLKKPMVLKSLVMVPLLLPFIVLPIIVLPMTSKVPLMAYIFFGIFWYPFLLLIVLSATIYPWLAWRNMYYILTNKRLIIRKGVVGIDYDILNLDKIQEINIDRGFWDKIYNTATITVRSIGVRPISLMAIPNYNEFYRILNDAIRRLESS